MNYLFVIGFNFSFMLMWRDVQYVIVEFFQVISLLDEGWKINGVGKRYNYKFGFGRLDVNKMVEMVLRWKNVNRQCICYGVFYSNKRFVNVFYQVFVFSKYNGLRRLCFFVEIEYIDND